MADKRITSLSALATTPAVDDYLVIVDISDTTDAATGTTKKITIANAFAGLQPIDADLTAIAGLSSTGIIARTGAGTASVRTITGQANKIVVADGDGVAGNPTLTIGTDIVTLTDTQALSNKTLTSPVLTTPSAFTTGGTITLAENTSIALDPAGSADGKYTGLTVTGTAGYTQAFGDLVYLDPTDSRWEACDANSAAAADGDTRGIIGMVVSAGTDGTACTILLQGIVRADAKFPTFTINNPIYASETAGAVTQTRPTTTDAVIRIVGFALTADEMYFNPENDYITPV